MVFDELMATGAVVTGRRTFDIARGWTGDHHAMQAATTDSLSLGRAWRRC